MDTARNFTKAPTGSTNNNVYLWIRLPPGRRLRKVAARDIAIGGRLIRLAMAGAATVQTTGPAIIAGISEDDHFPLKCETQGSLGEWVEWEGDIEITDGFPYAIAQFNDTIDGNGLRLQVGWE